MTPSTGIGPDDAASDGERPQYGLFAGFGVSAIAPALDWYQRFFDSEPSFRPNDREAVWQVNDNGWFYVEQLARFGNSMTMLMAEDLDGVVAGLADRGFTPARIEEYDEGMRKVVYADDDGNELSYGGISHGGVGPGTPAD